MRAIVVFSDTSTHPLARVLKRGFRHCSVCLESNGLWIEIDGREGVPSVRYLTQSDDFDLPAFYRGKGCTVVETVQRDQPVIWPLLVRNCVGVVKGHLCLNSWALTPYQLYRYLKD